MYLIMDFYGGILTLVFLANSVTITYISCQIFNCLSHSTYTKSYNFVMFDRTSFTYYKIGYLYQSYEYRHLPQV